MKILLNDYCGYPFEVDLVVELAKRGIEVEVCFTQASGGPKAFSGVNLGDVHVTDIELPPLDKQSYFRRWGFESSYGKAVVEHIRAIKPDIVISANTPLAAQRRIVNYCRKSEIQFIFWQQDIISIAAGSILKKKMGVVGQLIGSFFRLLEIQALKRSDHIIVIDQSFHEVLQDWNIPLEKVTVLSNWSPLDRIPVLPKQNEFAESIDLTKTFNIVYSGTLGMKHNPSIISELSQGLIHEEDVRLLAVTDGLGFEFLQEAKEKQNLDNLLLLPLQPFEKLPQVLATADLLLVLLEPDASKFSVPSKVWSAFCAARPSILVMPEDNLSARIATRSNAGVVISSQNVTEIISAVKKLKIDPSALTQMGKNARSYAEENFNISNITDKFENLFESLLFPPK